MSFSFEIVDGDLSLTGGDLSQISGTRKLAHDLGLWLREYYGVDRFHPNYGSTLDSYVGDVIDDLMLMQVEQEVLRVCSVYQKLQLLALKKDPGKYTMDELLDSVIGVKVSVDYDRINIDLSIRTAQGSEARVKEQISIG